MKRNVVMCREAHIAKDFSREAIGDPDAIIIHDHNSFKKLLGRDPKKITAYFLWLRITPVGHFCDMREQLDRLQAMGIRPIVVCDW